MRAARRLPRLAPMLLGLLAGPAWAQDCPAGGIQGADVQEGQTYKVVAVSPDDAYYNDRADIIGRIGEISSVDDDGCWVGGRMEFTDGSSKYFYQVELVPAERPDGLGALLGTPAGGCPPGAVVSIRYGERLQVLDIHSGDAYYPSRGSYLGRSGTDQGLTPASGSPCYFGGSFMLDDGTSMYFYKAAFTRGGGGASAKPKLARGANCPEGSYAGPIWSGQRVTVLEVHRDDAWKPDAAEIEGRPGKVETSLEGTGCWLQGAVRDDDGTYRFFHKVAVGEATERELPVLRPATRADEVAAGTRVQIVDVHYYDFYNTKRDAIVGKECVVGEGDLVETGPSWLGGQLTCGKRTYSFFRVRVAEL